MCELNTGLRAFTHLNLIEAHVTGKKIQVQRSDKPQHHPEDKQLEPGFKTKAVCSKSMPLTFI